MKSKSNDIPTSIIYDDKFITETAYITNSFRNFLTSVAQSA